MGPLGLNCLGSKPRHCSFLRVTLGKLLSLAILAHLLVQRSGACCIGGGGDYVG